MATRRSTTSSSAARPRRYWGSQRNPWSSCRRSSGKNGAPKPREIGCSFGIDFEAEAGRPLVPMNTGHHPVRMNLKLRELAQLFNSMDPSPFLDRDLDHDAEEFIVA